MTESNGVHCCEGRTVKCEHCGDQLHPVTRRGTTFYRHATNKRCIGYRQPRGVGRRLGSRRPKF